MKYKEVPDITLKMIIESGLIKPNSKVFATPDLNITGILNQDGSISLTIDKELRNFPYPSGAARAIAKTSVNGWVFWKTLDLDVYRELAYFKKQYLLKYR